MPHPKRKPGGRPLPRGSMPRIRPGGMVSGGRSLGSAMNRGAATRGRGGPSRRVGFTTPTMTRARKRAAGGRQRGVRY